MKMSRNCTDCGSSDGLSMYEDHNYCHSCKRYTRLGFDYRTTQKRNVRISIPRDATLKTLPTDFAWEIPEEGMQWLAKANISPKLIRTYNIGYSPSWRRVVIPSYFEGDLLGWQGRAVFPGQAPKYLQAEGQKPVLFMSHSAKSHPPFIVLVEDAASAIVLGEYLPTVSILGTSLDRGGNQIGFLSELSKNFVLWLDNDPAGRKATRIIEARLDNIAFVLETLSTDVDPKHVPHIDLLELSDYLRRRYEY